ncbi:MULTISPECIES: polysaccharide biosynthesis/export family protein [unclassified Sphingomonas]|uniref:polysaccharide biosynthesis/export family protein n=1 Tax=unclassified Sphingomonas TaxID=196159 RepID=UPI00190FD2D8|nr:MULTISPECIES: polysaccharide biosynthesis/export family protein [unclassified Sphingomonas]
MAEPGQLPPPTTIDLIAPSRPFVLGPLDQISVEVYGLPEFSRTVQVDASGQIALPLVGSIQAAGKAPAQVAAEYAASLRRQYIRDPRVTVNLTDTVSQTVSVGGAVGAPGIYPVTARMTLLRAIARAEGVSEFGREKEVVVYRRVNNRDMAALYDLRAIRQGMYPDPEIYANDVIEIGESRGRRIFRDVITAAPLLSVPLIALLN